ncbi:MAG: ABC transporter ATP-binding protein [Anaerolineales bacterium]
MRLSGRLRRPSRPTELTDFAVELIEVTKTFPTGKAEEIAAVDRVSLSIKHGEFFSLLGPSGCGKTTTLRMIAGFELPTRGEIRIHGKSMGETPPYQRRVNTVFQNYALFPHMTVYGNVAFGLEMDRAPRPEIRERVSEALRLVRLPGMEDRRPKQLSGGQQQRVALARALVKRPAVLLLDEPLGALDLKLRKAMQIELKHIQHEVGITFIYVTHDQEEALTMSDRIAVMSEGQVLQLGSAAEIYESPASRFVADFIGETNFLDGEVESFRDGLATVLVDGTLRLTAPSAAPDLKIGQPVTFTVRPEKIGLHSDLTDRSVSGQIEEVVYIGTDTRYLVRVSEGSRLVARVQNVGSTDQAGFRQAEQVYLTWDPDVARILTK